MALVKLITTGKMELKALGACLKQLFPHDDFEMVAMVGGGPYDGFTTDPLPLVGTRTVDNLRTIVRRMAIETESSPQAFVFALDDIELANVKNPDLAVAHIRAAVSKLLQERYDPVRGKADVNWLRQQLRGRCSFHFAVPMIESWLFADPTGPTNVRVPPGSAVHFNRLGCRPHRDPEQFRTRDPGFRQDHARNYSVRKKAPPWLKADRRRHPKNYLRYLCRNTSEADKWTDYKETHGGVDALQALDWGAVLLRDAWMPFARALVADLADALGVTPPALRASGQTAPLTTLRGGRPTDGVLRNL